MGELVTLSRSPIASINAAPRASWWVHSTLGSDAGDAAVLSMRCPGCNRAIALRILDTDGTAEGHDVDSDGRVFGPVACPYVGCGWSAPVKLHGWVPVGWAVRTRAVA